MDSMLLSIIIPVYNVAQYIVKCVDSIINQEIKGKYEIILVENGSSDDSYEVVESLSMRYPDIVRLIRIDIPDVSKARNIGIDCAKGKYVTFIDGDDWIEPTMFGALLDIAQSYDADIVESNYFLNVPGKELRIIGDSLCLNEGKVYVKNGLQAMADILLEKCTSSPCGRIYLRKFLGKECRFPEGVFYEDHACIYRWSSLAEKVVHLDKAFYHYEIRPGSTTGITQKSRKKAADFFNAEFDRIAFVSGNELMDVATKKEVIRHITHRCIHIFGKVCIIAYGADNIYNSEMLSLRSKLLDMLNLPWSLIRYEDRIRLLRIKYGWRGYAMKKMRKSECGR